MPASFMSVASRYLSERVVNPKYAKRVLSVAAGCRTFSEDACNRYLKKRISTASSATVAPERIIVVSLWRWAYDRRIVLAMPRGIVKIKVARPPVRAWTLEQCCTAVKGTFTLDSQRLRNGVSLGKFLRCWLLLGYETGARHADLWAMRDSDFAGECVSWTQGKTGNPVSRRLSAACRKAVEDMLAYSPDGRVLGFVMRKEGGYKRMRKHLRSLGMSGSPKWLRRSGATHVEMARPGSARLHLGHRTAGLAEKFYIDWGQVNRDIPEVPLLLK